MVLLINENNVFFNEKEFNIFIEKIKSGTLFLEENNDYEDNNQFNFEIEETYYDKFECIDKINEYIYLGKSFIKNKEYGLAYQILNALARIKVLLVIPGCDFKEWISFNQLCVEGYLEVDDCYFYQQLIYSAIQSHRGFREIYQLFELTDLNFCEFSAIITLYGNEIQNKDSLIHNWINCLKNIKTDLATVLLKDICTCINNNDELLRYARNSYQNHPILYLIYLQRVFELKDYSQGIKVGYEAIEAISDNLEIKAEIADLILKYEDSNYLKEIAFLANPSSYHCLRLTDNLEEIKNKFSKISYQQQNNCIKELKKSELLESERYYYLFILGDYENIINLCFNNQTDLKEKIVKTLLLLLKPDFPAYQGDRQLMISLQKALDFNESHVQFVKYFKAFKKRFHPPYKLRTECILWLKQEVALNAEEKVGGGKRQDYLDVASEVVVLAQILVQEKQIDNLDTYLEMFKKKYSIKRGFKKNIDESREFK